MITKEDIERIKILAESSTNIGNYIGNYISKTFKFLFSKTILIIGGIIIIIGFIGFGIFNRKIKINDIKI